MSGEPIFSIGIDQSQRGFGVSMISSEDGKVYGTTTCAADKGNYKEQSERFYELLTDVKAWIDPMRYNYGRHNNIIVCREDHSFQQYGHASANLEIAGMIDFMFQSQYGLVPGKTLFKCLPNVWMSWFKVKKPKREAPKKRKGGETDEQFAARRPSIVFDPNAYAVMYPTLGNDEHQIDASFLAFAGIKLRAQEK